MLPLGRAFLAQPFESVMVADRVVKKFSFGERLTEVVRDLFRHAEIGVAPAGDEGHGELVLGGIVVELADDGRGHGRENAWVSRMILDIDVIASEAKQSSAGEELD